MRGCSRIFVIDMPGPRRLHNSRVTRRFPKERFSRHSFSKACVGREFSESPIAFFNSISQPENLGVVDRQTHRPGN